MYDVHLVHDKDCDPEMGHRCDKRCCVSDCRACQQEKGIVPADDRLRIYAKRDEKSRKAIVEGGVLLPPGEMLAWLSLMRDEEAKGPSIEELTAHHKVRPEGFDDAVAAMDAELDDVDWSAKSTEPSESYLQLTKMGWVYDGIHGRGGGMGYGCWHEFVHPKYGRLAFESRLSDQIDPKGRSRAVRDEVAKHEARHPYRFYTDWYLIFDPGGYGHELEVIFNRKGPSPIHSGNGLDELERVLAELVQPSE